MLKKTYYGWYIVAASLILIALDGLLLYSFGIFMPYLKETYGFTHTVGSSLFSVRCFVFAFSMILAGRLTDKYDPRIVIFSGGIVAALGIMLSSFATETWHLLVTYSIMAGFGNGFFYIPCITVISRWFNNKRALAIGIATIGVPVSGMVVNPLTAWFISFLGVNKSFIALSLIFLLALLSSFILRSKPEDLGLKPYGEYSLDENSEEIISNRNPKEVLATSNFWILYLIFWLGMNTFLIIVINLFDFAIDSNLDPLVASGGPAAIGFGSIFGRLFFSGIVTKYMSNSRVLFTSYFLEACSILIILYVQTAWSLYLFGFLFGFFYSGHMPIFPTLLGNFYGTKGLGVIFGIFGSGFSLAAITGPIIAGLIFDKTGSHYQPIILATVLCYVASLLTFLIKMPTKDLLSPKTT